MLSKPKAYSYVRFSTPEQARGDSRRRQYKKAIEYADKHGLELVKDSEYAFLDAGISAYRGNNITRITSSLGQFYEFVRSGKISAGSYLLVESLDRLSRDQVTEALPRFLELLNAGIIVVTFGDGTVYKKSTNVMQLVMSIFHMARAHEESAVKGSRVSDAWQNKQALARSERRPLGGACPQWLSFDGEAYRVIPERVLIVRRVFELTVQGYGQRAIVKMFNEEGVPAFGTTKRNKSGLWGNSSVAKILSNRSVLGEYQPNIWTDGKRRASGDPIMDYYPPVVDEELFYAALEGRKARDVTKATKPSINFNLWSKIAVCAYCQSPMHLVDKGKPPKGSKYLRCSKSARGACTNKLIRLDRSEVVFKEMLAKLNMAALIKNDLRSLRGRVSELDGRMEEMRAKLNECSGLLMVHPSKTLAETIQRIETEMAEMQKSREQCMFDMSSEHVLDKSNFFERLDLVSYEGRYLANRQVQRLEVMVRMKHDEIRVQYNVMVAGLPKFVYMCDHGKDIVFVPFSMDMLKTSIRQDDMHATGLIFNHVKMLEAAMAGEDMAEFRGNLPENAVGMTFNFSNADNERAKKSMREWFDRTMNEEKKPRTTK